MNVHHLLVILYRVLPLTLRSKRPQITIMNTFSSSQPIYSPTITLIITPYRTRTPSDWTRRTPLRDLLQAIVSQHSVPNTAYQSAFYRDVNDRYRFYHLQTSPSEPSIGWLNYPSLKTNNKPVPAKSFALTNNPPLPKPSLEEHLTILHAYATPESSDGVIALGMRSRRNPPQLTRVPFNAEFILIGSRNVSGSPDARPKLKAELGDQLMRFWQFTASCPVAGGWRQRGYTAYQAAGESEAEKSEAGDAGGEADEDAGGGMVPAEQFVTVSGWNSMEQYEKFKRLTMMADERNAWRNVAGRVSADVVGHHLIWGKKIA
jgi:hypothetical protein